MGALEVSALIDWRCIHRNLTTSTHNLIPRISPVEVNFIWAIPVCNLLRIGSFNMLIIIDVFNIGQIQSLLICIGVSIVRPIVQPIVINIGLVVRMVVV